MARMTARIETGFERLGRFLFRRRLATVALMTLIVAALAAQLPRITFDTSTEGLFHPDDPAIADYNAFRDQFGRDELIVIAVNPPDVFDIAFLKKLTAFHRALESEVPYLDEITSLVNARQVRGEGDALVVEDLLRELPRDERELQELRERVLRNPLYRNQLISPDGRLTTLVIKSRAYSSRQAESDLLAGFEAERADPAERTAAGTALTDRENSAIVRAAQTVAERFADAGFPVYVAGSPVVTDLQKRAMQQDMMRFLALAVGAIALFLGVLFRRLSGVVLPLLIVLVSLVSTLGLMAVFGVPFKTPTTILPSFLLAVGVGASIHLLVIFYQRIEVTGDREEAVAHALAHSGLPVMMTSFTAAVGLASFGTAQLAPIADLGTFAALGELLCLVYTLLLLPALLAWVPVRRGPLDPDRASPALNRVLTGLGDFAATHPAQVLMVTGVLVALSAAGIALLRFSHNSLTWFPESTAIRQASDKIDRELGGAISIEVVVDTGRENGLYDPALLRGLERVADYAQQYRQPDGRAFVGKTQSLADVVKEINQALHEGRPEAYTIPDSRGLVAQELLLFENSGSDDLEDVTDSRFSKARLTAKVAWDDASAYVRFVDDLRAFAAGAIGEENRATVTGFLVLFTRAIDAMMRSMAVSYAISLGVISLLMVLLVGDVRIGLLSMVPNLVPILFTLGLMGWLGLRLDMFTLLIGSISIGLAVDDTIHFFHNFRRSYAQHGDTRAAVRETLQGTGRAALFATLVLVTGFWLFMFASLNNLFNFGLLSGFTLAVGAVAEIFLSPALLSLVIRTGWGEALARRWSGRPA